jgi:UDP-glucose 4-epimerase
LRKAVVTGAAGYIGGRLVGALLDGDWDVHALVREPAPRLAAEQTVCDLAAMAPETVARICEGADVIVHLAGENEVLAASQPAAALSSTVVATHCVAQAAAHAGVKRVVYLSTVHVYGARIAAGVTVTEAMRPEPRSAYAISRLASEHVAAAPGGYDLVVLRLTNAVGAPSDPAVDRWSLVANDLCRQSRRERTTSARAGRQRSADWRR